MAWEVGDQYGVGSKQIVCKVSAKLSVWNLSHARKALAANSKSFPAKQHRATSGCREIREKFASGELHGK